MALPITAVYAGVLTLWVLFLAFKVVGFRGAKKVSLGDGGHADGLRLIRGHANAVETIPLFVIMLGLAEGLGMPVWLLHVFGLAFAGGRIVHGVHFLEERDGITLRFFGMLTTVAAMACLALGLIALGLF